MSLRVPRVALRVALVPVALVMLVSCGSDDTGGSADTAPSDGASDAAAASTAPAARDGDGRGRRADHDAGGDDGAGAGGVERGPFCDELDPAEIGELLGVDDAEVIAEAQPGEQVTPAPGAAPTPSQAWSCTVGTTAGSSVAATWNLGSTRARRRDANAVVAGITGSLPGGCRRLSDDTLGVGTRGADCAGTARQAGGAGYTVVVRANVVGDALLECYLASTSPDDLESLAAAAPHVCGMFRDEVAVG